MEVLDIINNKGVRAGAIMSYIYMAVSIVVQLIYVPLLLSCIGQDEYGLYQLIGSIMAYIVSINGILAAGVGRYYCMYKAKGDELMMENTLAIAKRMYWAMSALTLAIMVGVTVVFRFAYASSFTPAQVDECSAMLLVLGINCVVTMNNAINISVITANERFVFLKGSQIIALVVQPALVIFLAGLFPSALTVTLVVLFMNVLCATAQRMYAKNVLKAKYAFHGWDWSLARGLIGFSASIIMVTLADQIFFKTDQLIVGYLFGAGPVAIYAVGAQIYTAYMSVGTAISSVFLPKVSSLYHHDHDMSAISGLFAKVGRLSLMVCLLVLGAFVVLGPDFMTLWAGDRYFDSYLIAVIVMVPFTIDLIQNLGLTILQVIDKYYFRGAMYLAIAVINVILTVILLNTVGLVGAAVSTAIAMFVGNGVVMNWYYKIKVGLDIHGFWRQMIPIVLPTTLLVSFFASFYWLLPLPHASWPIFIAAGFLWVVAYSFALWKFSMNAYEKSLVCSLFHRR